MPSLFRHLNLEYPNREIYLRNCVRRTIISTISALVIVATLYYYHVNRITNILDSRAVSFIVLSLLVPMLDWFYVLFKRQSYWHLTRQDVAKGLDQADEMLKKMKEVGSAKR